MSTPNPLRRPFIHNYSNRRESMSTHSYAIRPCKKGLEMRRKAYFYCIVIDW
jgi:hypothetical protein